MNSILDIINWLNSNQGFVMIVLTIVYVLATIIIVIYTRKSIQQSELTREEESRPYIFANLHKDPRDLWFSLRIKNYGKTGAKIKSISITPTVKLNYDKDVSEMLNNIVMAPSQLMQVGIMNKKEEIYKIENFTVTIKYSPTYNLKKEYDESYEISSIFAKGLSYEKTTRNNKNIIENELINISQYLDSIRNKL